MLALLIDFFPGCGCPTRERRRASGRSRRSSASTSRAACASSTRPCPSTARPRPRGDLAVIRDIVERRVNSTGVAEPVVTTQGTDRIVVELPGVTDPDAVRELVGQTGRLDFVPLRPDARSRGPGRSTSRHLPAAVQRRPGLERRRSAPDPTTGGLTVNFVLKDDGAKLFADYTAAHVGELLRDHPRRGGHLGAVDPERDPQRPGPDQPAASAASRSRRPTNLVTILRFGSLPFPIEELSSEQISATLGERVPRPEPARRRDRDPARHRVHDHLLPAAGRDRRLRADLLHARRRSRSSGSSRSR